MTVKTRHHNAAQHREDIATQVNTNTTNISTLQTQALTLGTEQASTSGTAIDFTNIPSWVQKITVMFVGVSTNNTSPPLIQLGDAGGFEASGYLGASSGIGGTPSSTNYTTGFGIRANASANILHGSVTISLEDAANFTWVASGVFATSNTAATFTTAGSKSLSDTLTQVRITTLNGTDTYDAGAINILYE